MAQICHCHRTWVYLHGYPPLKLLTSECYYDSTLSESRIIMYVTFLSDGAWFPWNIATMIFTLHWYLCGDTQSQWHIVICFKFYIAWLTWNIATMTFWLNESYLFIQILMVRIKGGVDWPSTHTHIWWPTLVMFTFRMRNFYTGMSL